MRVAEVTWEPPSLLDNGADVDVHIDRRTSLSAGVTNADRDPKDFVELL